MEEENLSKLADRHRELEKEVLRTRYEWEKVRTQLSSMFDSGERFFIVNSGAWGYPSFDKFPDRNDLKDLFGKFREAVEKKREIELQLRKHGLQPNQSNAWIQFLEQCGT
ncbi:MAG: hypothetical protein OXG88_07620 [Gammaproteobacteria bacterium]|nr:hypothetical protein [Gammaproteobacteria bacterium]